MKLKEKIELILFAIVIIAVLAALYRWPDWILSEVMEWGISIMTGIILSAIAGGLVEGFTGDLLKKISFNIHILGFDFSITLFFIVALFVRFWLF